MYGIIGEDPSDVATLKVLVKRLAGDESLSVQTKGYSGCAEMLRKGAKQFRLFRDLGCNRFIACHDADGPNPAPKHRLVAKAIVKPSGIDEECCIVVPVQELEAWILADIECASAIFTSWKPPAVPNPERVPNPKEHLERLSGEGKSRPRYSHATHNQRMAKYLDLKKVSRKCPSFRVLEDFVAGEPGD